MPDGQKSNDMKNKLKENWTETTIPVYRTPNSLNAFQTADATQRIKAKRAVYEMRDKFGRWHTQIIFAFADKKCQKMYLGLESDLYVVNRSGIYGLGIMSGWIDWEPTFVEVPETGGGLKEAIAKFEKDFDMNAVWKRTASEKEPRTNLEAALGAEFFTKGSTTAEVKIERLTIDGSVLQLDLENNWRSSHAKVWVDLETRSVVKALIDGKAPPSQ